MRRVAPLLLAACNVAAPPSDTGGAKLDPASACPRALVVVSSDYASTTVSLVAPDGRVLSDAFLSSGSAPVGLTQALSGDVVVPHEPTSGEVVLIDRYPNATLTWADPTSGKVTRQLSVRTGFASNPHDYLEISGSKAWVTRYETNTHPGKEPFDGGGDVLVLDRLAPTITGRIDLAPESGGVPPRPETMTRLASGLVVVPLGRLSQDVQRGEDARLVGLDPTTDSVAFRVDVPGVSNCIGAALSPARRSFALACTGVVADDANRMGRSGVVIFDVAGAVPREVSRYKLDAPPSASLAFVDEDRVVVGTFGDLTKGRPDLLYALDVRSGAVAKIASSGAFSLGSVVCGEACARTCVVANASEHALSVFETRALAPAPSIGVARSTRLPPRIVGLMR